MSNQPSQTVIAAAIDATARILANQKEAFDPESETDRAWWSATFEFILATAVPVPEPEGYTEAFPGAEVVQLPEPPPGTVMQFPGQPQPMAPQMPQPQYQPAPPQSQYPAPQAMPWGAPPPPQPQPQGFGGPTSEEELWGMLIRELQAGNGQAQNWYDNRLSKKGPNYPDFRHKSIPDPRNSRFKMGLFLNKAPAWALQALQMYPPR